MSRERSLSCASETLALPIGTSCDIADPSPSVTSVNQAANSVRPRGSGDPDLETFEHLAPGSPLSRGRTGVVSQSHALTLHGAALDFKEPIESAGRLRGLHHGVATTRPEERIGLVLGETFIGLPRRLVHRCKGRAG